MKNSEIVNGLSGLALLVESEKEFSVKVGYAIAKNLRILKEAYAVYDAEREKIMKDFDDQNEEQRRVTNKKVKELLEINNEDIKIQKISYEDLQECGSMKTKEFAALEFMVKEEE